MDKLEEELMDALARLPCRDGHDPSGDLDIARRREAARACAVIARKQVEELEAALSARGGLLVGGGGGKAYEVTILFENLDAAWRCNNAIMALPRAALHRKGVELKCCDGGPQWGHALDCPKCPE